TLGTPTFVRPELALGLPPSLKPRHECEEPGAHLSVSCREVDLAIDGRHIDAGVHQRVHVPRRAQQSVDVHGDDQLEQSRFGVDKHPGPVGLGPAGLRGGDVVILVPVEDLPVACAAQLRDLSALCLDTPPFACCVHRDTYVSGDLLHLTNVTTPTCTMRIRSIWPRKWRHSTCSRISASPWASAAVHRSLPCAAGRPSGTRTPPMRRRRIWRGRSSIGSSPLCAVTNWRLPIRRSSVLGSRCASSRTLSASTGASGGVPVRPRPPNGRRRRA